MNFFLIDSSVLNNVGIPQCVDNVNMVEDKPVARREYARRCKNTMKDKPPVVKRKYVRRRYRYSLISPVDVKPKDVKQTKLYSGKRPYRRAPKINKRLDCDVCKTTFGTKYDLLKHQLEHMKKNTSIQIDHHDKINRHHKKDLPVQIDHHDKINRHHKKDLPVQIDHHDKINRHHKKDLPVQIDHHNKINRHRKKDLPIMSEEVISICEICQKTFHSKNDLHLHYQIHAEPGDFVCDECSRPFKLEEDLEEHILFHKEPIIYPYVCNLCPKAFAKKSSFIIHQCVKQFSCEVCTKAFKTNSELMVHKNEMHSKMIHKCEVCEQTFDEEESLHSHFNIHVFDGPFSCKICQEEFKTHSELKEHQIRAHDDSKISDHENTFEEVYDTCQTTFHEELCMKSHCIEQSESFDCDVCRQAFETECDLNKHKLSTHSDIEVSHDHAEYACEICLTSFVDEKTLRVHSAMHTDGKLFFCHICSQHFQLQSDLKCHLESHTMKKQSVSEKFLKPYKKKQSLKMHQCVHTGENKLCICPDCRKKFRGKVEMEIHRILNHPVKSSDCNLCKTTLIRKYAFQRHQRSFRSNKSFICNICRRAFRFRITLEAHYQSHKLQSQLPQKPFICQLCKKGFNSKSILHLHYRVHTGEKPFACDYCPKAYAFSHDLTRHMRIHTGTKAFTCNVCKNSFKTKYELQKHECLIHKIKKLSDTDQKSVNSTHLQSGAKCLNKEPLVCDVCKQGFETTFALEEHELIHIKKHDSQKEFDANRKENLYGECQMDLSDKKSLHTHNVTPVNNESGICNSNINIFEANTEPKEHELNVHIKNEVFESQTDSAYLCEICHTAFMDKESLQSHYSLHKSDEVHNFNSNQNTFKIVSEVTNHQFDEHNEGNASQEKLFNEIKFICNVCQTSFLEEKHLLSHYAVHKKGKSFVCHLCSKTFVSRMNLKRHILSHTYKKPYVCDKCPKAFLLKSYLTKHKLTHIGWKPYACGTCNEAFTTKSELKEHLFFKHKTDYLSGIYQIKSVVEFLPLHKAKNLEQFFCHVCKKGFKSKSDLNKHEIIHSIGKNSQNVPVNITECESRVCRTVFSDKENLLTHSVAHNSNEPIICDTCQKTFKTNIDLKEHKISIHNKRSVSQNNSCIEKNQYVCEICQEVLSDEKCLQSHSNEPFLCKVCQESFKVSLGLKRHQLDLHNNTKISESNNDKTEYLCDICQTSFTEDKDLWLHYAIHKGKKSFVCHLCSKVFKLKDSLKNHLASHASKNLFICNKNPKVHAEKSSLKKHLCTNTSEKSFVCFICKKAFKSKLELKRHQNCMHNKEHLFRMNQEATSQEHFISEVEPEKEVKISDDQSKGLQNRFPVGNECINETVSPSEENLLSHSMGKKLTTYNGEMHYPGIKSVQTHPFLSSDPKPFYCRFCQESFKKSSEVRLHELDEHFDEYFAKYENCTDKEKYTCDICQAVCGEKEHLNSHYNIHKNEKLFNCHLCSKNFMLKNTLKKHLVSHTGKKLSKRSAVCQKGYLMMHNHVPTGDKSFVCNTYKKVSKIESEMQKHQIQKQKIQSFSEMNQAAFSSGKHLPSPNNCENEDLFLHDISKQKLEICQTLKEHKFVRIKVEDSEAETSVTCKNDEILFCDVCKKEFSLISELKEHKFSHIVEKEQQNENPIHIKDEYVCGVCQTVFANEESLLLHYATHSSVESFSCDACQMAFTSNIQLEKHNLTVHHQAEISKSKSDIAEKGYQNGICKMELFHKKSLQSCVKVNHELFSYETSQKSFNTSSVLDNSTLDVNNVQKVSENESCLNKNENICDICLASFMKKEGLLLHYRLHKKDESFVCHLCSKMFVLKDSLKHHLELHIGEKLFVCDKCPKAYTTKSYLTRHKRVHTGKKPFLCSVCNKRFKTRTELKKHHLRIHSSKNLSQLRPKASSSKVHVLAQVESIQNDQFFCDVCKIEFSTNSELNEHILIHTNDIDSENETITDMYVYNNEHMCDICLTSFMKKEDLRLHYRIHKKNKSFICHLCPRIFVWKDSLKHHLALHTGEKLFVCDKCPKAYATKGYLTRHKHVHTGKKPFLCNVCNKGFKTNTELKRHQLRIHKRKKISQMSSKTSSPEICLLSQVETKNNDQYFCDVCEKEFTTDSELKKHVLLLHTKGTDSQNETLINMHVCKVCQVIFHDENHLQSHYATHICGKLFKTTIELQDHKHNVHIQGDSQTQIDIEKEEYYVNQTCQVAYLNERGTLQSVIEAVDKPFTCDEGSFEISSELKNHELNVQFDEKYPKCSSDNKEYICDICHIAFSAEGLDAHYAIHKNDKFYSCNLCSKIFLKKDSLRSHLVSHTGQKLFACAICPKAYAVKSYLIRHLRVHTGEKPFICDICGKGFKEKYELDKHLLRLHKVQKLSGKKLEGLNSNVVPSDIAFKKEMVFTCNDCEEEFETKWGLKKHKMKHIEKKNSQDKAYVNMMHYICRICQLEFPDEESLQSHSINHTNDKAVSCDACGERFKTTVQLTDHKINFHKQEELSQNEVDIDKSDYFSNMCQLAFDDKEGLQLHTGVHSDMKSFVCGVCMRVFKTNAALKSHERNIHKDRKVSKKENSDDHNEHVCDICEVTFAKDEDLHSHYSIHKKKTSYVCHLCSQFFKQKSSLKQHLPIHNGKKLLHCEKCPKAFAVRSSWKKHQLVHSDEKPFVCDTCKKGFKTKSELKKHDVRMHMADNFLKKYQKIVNEEDNQ